MADDYTNDVARYLGEYIFQNVYAQPNAEYRTSVIPLPIHQAVVRDVLNLRSMFVDLPKSNTRFYTYSVSPSQLGGTDVSSLPNRWIDGMEFHALTKFEINIYDAMGLCIPRAITYYRASPESDNIVIVINADTWEHVYDTEIPEIVVDLRHDPNNDLTIKTYTDVTLGQPQQYDIFNNHIPGADKVFIDGRLTPIMAREQLVGRNIEIVKDNRIIGKFTINLGDRLERRNYVSLFDNRAMTIVHIPKALNPNNVIITHHTCDFGIGIIGQAGVAYDGRHILRGAANQRFRQITHNDIGIADYVIAAYENLLKNRRLELTVYVRSNPEAKTLIRSSNFIDVLYREYDDKGILDQMEGQRGTNDPTLDIWSAAALEASTYTRAIVNGLTNLEFTNIKTHIDILGYDNVAGMLGNNTFEFVLDEPIHKFKLALPIAYTNSKNVLPVVFVNGRKLAPQYAKQYSANARSVVVAISDEITLHTDDIVTIDLIELRPDIYEYVTPSIDENKLDIQMPIWSTYQVHRTGPTTEYEKIDNFDDDGKDIIFPTSSYGNEYVIVFHLGGEIIPRIDINQYIHNFEPLIIDMVTGEHKQVILGEISPNVYMNGYSLVEGVDFHIIDHVGDNGTYRRQLVVQGIDRLNKFDGVEHDNWLEIHYTRDHITNGSAGITYDGFLNGVGSHLIMDESAHVWVDGLSRLIVNGLRVNTVTPSESNIRASEYYVGAVFGIRTRHSLATQIFIRKYENNNSSASIRSIAELLQSNTTIIPNMANTKQHKIYSIYTATILHDFLSMHGCIRDAHNPLTTFETLDGREYYLQEFVGFDPESSRLLEMVRIYDYLLEFDLAHTLPLNEEYIEVLPAVMWRIDSSFNPQQKKLSETWINTLLTSDIDTDCDNMRYVKNVNNAITLTSQSSVVNGNVSMHAIDMDDNTYTETDNHINPDDNVVAVNIAASGKIVFLSAGRTYDIRYTDQGFAYMRDNNNMLCFGLEIETPAGDIYPLLNMDDVPLDAYIEPGTTTFTANETGGYILRPVLEAEYTYSGELVVTIHDTTTPVGRAYWECSLSSVRAVHSVKLVAHEELRDVKVMLLNKYKRTISSHLHAGIVEGETLFAYPFTTIDGEEVEYCEVDSIRVELQPYINMTSRKLQLVECSVYESLLLKMWKISRLVYFLGKQKLINIEGIE